LGEKCVDLEVNGAGQKGRFRNTWKEIENKDVNDLHLNQVMLWIVVSGGNDKREMK